MTRDRPFVKILNTAIENLLHSALATSPAYDGALAMLQDTHLVLVLTGTGLRLKLRATAERFHITPCNYHACDTSVSMPPPQLLQLLGDADAVSEKLDEALAQNSISIEGDTSLARLWLQQLAGLRPDIAELLMRFTKSDMAGQIADSMQNAARVFSDRRSSVVARSAPENVPPDARQRKSTRQTAHAHASVSTCLAKFRSHLASARMYEADLHD